MKGAGEARGRFSCPSGIAVVVLPQLINTQDEVVLNTLEGKLVTHSLLLCGSPVGAQGRLW